jgi:hypothetical protein
MQSLIPQCLAYDHAEMGRLVATFETSQEFYIFTLVFLAM